MICAIVFSWKSFKQIVLMENAIFTYAKHIVNFIVPFALYYFSIMKPYSSKVFLINQDTYDKIYNNKELVVFCLCGLLVILYLVENLIDHKKKELKRLLDVVLQRYGGCDNFRITLFKKKLGITIFLQYFYKCLIVNFIKHKKRGLISYYFINWIRPWKSYLIVYARVGEPLSNGSSTYILIPDNDYDDKYGLVSHYAYRVGTGNKSLPDLDALEIADHFSMESIKANKLLYKRVIDYMNKCGIKEYDDLRRFHFLPKHMWLSTLIDKHDNTWGVMVLESKHQDSPFEQSANENVQYYRIISSHLREQ